MNPQTSAVALAAAREAAAAAAEIITHYWRSGVEVELKADATPVTVADREAEQAIRRVLQAALPQAAIYGEEFGLQGERDALLWLVDPLDGTKSFVRRTPLENSRSSCSTCRNRLSVTSRMAWMMGSLRIRRF